MKKSILLGMLALSMSSFAQLTVVPNGENKKAIVGERIGITDVTIHYDRPGVKGREGNIYGKLVPHGFNDLGFGTSKAAPWRAGANENTTIEFSNDVKIEGKDLPAGKYGKFQRFFILAFYFYPQSIFLKAMPQAPDPGNKVNLEKYITILQQGKDINQ